MADRSKFEEMLVRLINEDKDGAEALFHEIVVAKSRDIYESLLEDEADIDEADDEEVDESDDDLDEADDEEVDESDDELEEGFDLDEFEVEADDDMMGGDPTDDMMGDIGMDDEGGDDMDMDDEGTDLDSAFDSVEDALEDLKAEFEKMLAGGDAEGDEADMDFGDEEGEEGDEGEMDFGDEEGDDEEAPKENYGFGESSKKSAGEQMREYVEKVGGATYNTYGKMGDNGVNTKSAVAKKNDMGGTTANLRGGESKSEGTQGGLANPSVKDMSTKNINVPGGKAGKTGFKKSEPGHGAEKKSAGDNGDKSTKSPINGLNSRSK